MKNIKERIQLRIATDPSNSHDGGDYYIWLGIARGDDGQAVLKFASSADFYTCPVCGNMDTVCTDALGRCKWCGDKEDYPPYFLRVNYYWLLGKLTDARVEEHEDPCEPGSYLRVYYPPDGENFPRRLRDAFFE